jgi:GDP-fucose transporter C1
MTSDYVYIASVIASYWVVSISMVYLNKILLSNEEASIPAPIFVTWLVYLSSSRLFLICVLVSCRYQCVITCLICYVLGLFGERYRKHGSGHKFFEEFPLVQYKSPTGMAVLPLSVIFVGMIAFNNLCLQYVEVSFCKFVQFHL